MGTGRNEVEELRSQVASLQRQLRSRDDYIVGLNERNRALRVDVYKHQAEVARLRSVLRQAGLTDAVRESSTRLAAATAALDPDALPPSTQPQGAAKRGTHGDE